MLDNKRKSQGLRAITKGSAVVLLLSLTIWPLLSFAQSSRDEAPQIDQETGAVTIGGYTLTPGNVDTSGWSEERKSVLVKFSLKLAENDKERFRELSFEKFETKLNDESIALGTNPLMRDNEPIKVLFMIDRSGSMGAGKKSGVDKLAAARESLRYFINNLDHPDKAAIYTFNLKQDEMVYLTDDKNRLRTGISGINSAQGDTSLYESIRFALNKAEEKDIQNIVFLSDGKEDTHEADLALREGRLDILKSKNEDELSATARAKNIPVFSIAIGENGAEGDRGVDYDTLKAISENSNGGTATLIDMANVTGGSSVRLTQELTEKLKRVLADIKKLLHFDYGVRVPLSNLKEGKGELLLKLTVVSSEHPDKQLTFPLVYEYSWNKKKGPPIFTRGKALTPEFIPILTSLAWSGLGQIYLLLLSPLVLLGLLPSVVNRIAVAIEMRRMTNAIQFVGHRSSLGGKQCPNELGPAGQQYVFKVGDSVLVCPRCHTPHHLSCWEYNGHQCMNRVCTYQFVIPSRVLAKYGITADPRKQFV